MAGTLVELNVGHTEANSCKVEESSPHSNSPKYHWPCLNAFFRTWRCNGKAGRITSFFLFVYFFNQANKFLVIKVSGNVGGKEANDMKCVISSLFL